MFSPDGSHPGFNIFHGQLQQISDKMTPRCHYFPKQCVVRLVCIHPLSKKTLLPLMNGQELSNFLLLSDKLKRQMQGNFKGSWNHLQDGTN